MSSFSELLQSITKDEINRVYSAGSFRRWCYFIDGEAKVVGIVCANDTSLAFYSISNDNSLKVGPLGVVSLANASYKPDPQQLVLISNGQFLPVFILNDLKTVDGDTLTDAFDYTLAKQWQDFLSSRGVSMKNTAPQQASNMPMKWQIAIGLGITLVIAAVMIFSAQPWNAT